MLHYLLKCCLLNCSGECISFFQGVRALIFPLHLLWAVCFLVRSVSSDVTDPPRGEVEVLAVERGRDSSQQPRVLPTSDILEVYGSVFGFHNELGEGGI